MIMKFAMRNTRLSWLVAVIISSSWFLASSSALQCATGLGSQVVDIPEEWLNDGYCDCPLDGADEPGTDACSGSQGWPGVVASRYVMRKSEN
jgi:protein kinase C substrate 80K-H